MPRPRPAVFKKNSPSHHSPTRQAAAATAIPTSGRLALLNAAATGSRLASLNATVKAPCPVTADNSFIYGVDDDGNLWETDVTCETSTAILDGASLLGNGNPQYFNGLAYNPSGGTGGTFFWFNSVGSVVSWVRESGSYGIVATSATLAGASAGNPSNGAWAYGAFWFVQTSLPAQLAASATVWAVSFDPPAVFGDLPSISGLASYEITFNEQMLDGFGDIVINEGNNLLYLAPKSQVGSPYNTTAPLYSVDVNELFNSGTAPATKVRATGVSTRQLSFDVPGTTLWTHDHNTGTWGTMDTADGTVTNMFQGPALRDIGGAASACPCSPAGDTYIYGIGNDKILYEIDVTSQAIKAVLDASPVRVV